MGFISQLLYLYKHFFPVGKAAVFINKEGSFGFKSTGLAFYQIKQKGIENYNIIKAICSVITGREAKPIKADSADCYQLSLASKTDVKKSSWFLFIFK